MVVVGQGGGARREARGARGGSQRGARGEARGGVVSHLLLRLRQPLHHVGRGEVARVRATLGLGAACGRVRVRVRVRVTRAEGGG